MKIMIICNDFSPNNLRKQPWRYIHEISQSFIRAGHQVILITANNVDNIIIDDIHIIKIKRLFIPFIGEPKKLINIINREKPDEIIMLIGITSFIRSAFNISPAPVGILTSPIYTMKELFLNIGIEDIIRYPRVVGIHVINALTPSFMVKHWEKRFKKIIVLSKWNKQRALQKGIKNNDLLVIPPGVDRIWLDNSSLNTDLQKNKNIKKIVYYTAPSPLRGTMDLIQAFNILRKTHNIKLQLLFRIDSDDSLQHVQKIKKYAEKTGAIDQIDFVIDNLSINELINELKDASLVCLPFKIVISDVPISLLESMSLGIPVISTNVSSIPEIIGSGGVCVPSNNPFALSDAINKMLADEQHSQKMGECGHNSMIFHITWEEVGVNFISMAGEN